MPTTSNFGWTTPADTDLVKNGALAIRTLGNGIDSSLLDLKGGTTGQILSKASNTDLDYTWINNDQGDITEVQAGTGISVTSGTGPIPTIALSTPVAATNGGTAQTSYATGDIVYASGTNTLAKRTIGSTDQILKVASGVPTWAYPTCIGVRLGGENVSQSIPNATGTDIAWTSEWFDSNGFHDNVTNNTRITIPTGLGGKYLMTASIYCDFADSTRRDISMNINGAGQASAFTNQVFASKGTVSLSVILNLNAGDYVTCNFYQAAGGARDISRLYSSFSAQFLGV